MKPKKYIALVCFAFMLLSPLVSRAQIALTLKELTLTGTGNEWKYKVVNCVSANSITSITLTMHNNTLVSNTSGILPSNTLKSLGTNPEVHTYLFAVPIAAADVVGFIKGMTFRVVNATISGSVSIVADANPTRLPNPATITTFDHPDGTVHYYVNVATYAGYPWDTAYREAKSYYFMGMRGYLATITSKEEDDLLTNISLKGAWSGGARVPRAGNTLDAMTWPVTTEGTNFYWTCGPESGFEYFLGKSFDGGGVEIGYANWYRSGLNEPNNSNGATERFMQVNYQEDKDVGKNLYKWNDLKIDAPRAEGYFIEFGGTDKAYSAGGVNYPKNDNYKTPTGYQVNDQWERYSPQNTSQPVTTRVAPLNSYLMIIK